MAYFDKYGVEFSDDRKTLVKCPKDFQGEYTIPDGVMHIRGMAFAGCEGLTAIEMPDSVIELGWAAFAWCENLQLIKFSKNITNIPGTSYYCYYIESEDYIDEGFDEPGMFWRCVSLREIVIPNGVTNIECGTCVNCSSLTTIVIPDSVTIVEEHAFEDCDKISEIYVPLGQEERFCQMEGLKDFSNIILKTSERRRQCEAEEQRLIEIQQQQELLYGSTLFFDTETTGILLGFNSKRPIKEYYNWPRLVQLAWIMTDKEGKVLKRQSHIIIPENFYIEDDAIRVHHITTERARQEGQLLRVVLDEFLSDLELAERIVCHNLDFDKGVVGAELYRHDMAYDMFMNKPAICTMKSSTDYCAIPKRNSDGYKWPSLQELYQKLFGRAFDDAHDALADTTATKECFFELKKRGIIK